MLVSDNLDIKELAYFLIELGVLSNTTPLEIILDMIIGSRDIKIQTEESEDEYYHNSIPKLKSPYKSNYKETYFGDQVLQGDIASFVHFLSSLRVFIYALREYKKGEKLLVSDLSEFVELHKEYRIALLNKTAFVGNINAINLMTAHKAKGLEFEFVFLIGAEEKKWIKAGRNNKLPLHKNMPFDRSPDTSDDFLRLFFVAITRAKHTIYLTHSGRIVPFIADELESNLLKSKDNKLQNDKILNGLAVYKIPPFAEDEKALLRKVLENYKLSPTHLSNFLNITKGGPKLFLEQNLLLFPQSKSSSAVYGSSIHKAIEEMYVITKKDKVCPSLERVLGIFEGEIKKSRLLQSDEDNLILKGREKLSNFYKKQEKVVEIQAVNSYMEVNFRNQSVELSGAQLTGKIDRLFMSEDGIEVIDIKSGKSFGGFEYNKTKDDDYENIKKHNYKHQLLMYKILLESSREYAHKKITKGIISFVDSDEIGEVVLDFTVLPSVETEDFKKLLIAVYTKINSLDFPDISKYQSNLEGILSFERDLIMGAI